MARAATLILLALCMLCASSASQDLCNVCKYSVSYVENALEAPAIQQDVEGALEKVCTVFEGTLKEECSQFITDNTPQLINLLVAHLDPQAVCEKVDACEHASYAIVDESGTECTVCETLFQFLYSELDKNSTDEEIKRVVESACVIFKGIGEEAPCKQIVDGNLVQIMRLLEDSDPPAVVCKKLGICKDDWRDMILSKGGDYYDRGLARAKAKAKQQIQVPEDIDLGLVMHKSGKYYSDGLKNAQTADNFEMAENAQPVDVAKTEDTKRDLGQFGLHKSGDYYAKHLGKQSFDCKSCGLVSTFLVGAFQTVNDKQHILSKLQWVCDNTIIMKKMCSSLVASHGDLLATHLAKHDSPEEICNALKCTSAQTSKRAVEMDVNFNFNFNWNGKPAEKPVEIPKPKPTQDKTPESTNFLAQKLKSATGGTTDGHQACQFCMWVISAVEAFATENTTVSELSMFMQNLCTFLPSEYIQSCVNFVDVYTPQLIEFLARRESPPTSCTQLGVCEYTLPTYKDLPQHH